MTFDRRPTMHRTATSRREKEINAEAPPVPAATSSGTMLRTGNTPFRTDNSTRRLAAFLPPLTLAPQRTGTDMDTDRHRDRDTRSTDNSRENPTTGQNRRKSSRHNNRGANRHRASRRASRRRASHRRANHRLASRRRHANRRRLAHRRRLARHCVVRTREQRQLEPTRRWQPIAGRRAFSHVPPDLPADDT